MKALVAVLALVVGVLALSLVWTNHTQVETISHLREQNGLLRALVEQERRLCVRLETLSRSYAQALGNVAQWLGLEHKDGLGGPLCPREGP